MKKEDSESYGPSRIITRCRWPKSTRWKLYIYIHIYQYLSIGQDGCLSRILCRVARTQPSAVNLVNLQVLENHSTTSTAHPSFTLRNRTILRGVIYPTDDCTWRFLITLFGTARLIPSITIPVQRHLRVVWWTNNKRQYLWNAPIPYYPWKTWPKWISKHLMRCLPLGWKMDYNRMIILTILTCHHHIAANGSFMDG